MAAVDYVADIPPPQHRQVKHTFTSTYLKADVQILVSETATIADMKLMLRASGYFPDVPPARLILVEKGQKKAYSPNRAPTTPTNFEVYVLQDGVVSLEIDGSVVVHSSKDIKRRRHSIVVQPTTSVVIFADANILVDILDRQTDSLAVVRQRIDVEVFATKTIVSEVGNSRVALLAPLVCRIIAPSFDFARQRLMWEAIYSEIFAGEINAKNFHKKYPPSVYEYEEECASVEGSMKFYDSDKNDVVGFLEALVLSYMIMVDYPSVRRRFIFYTNDKYIVPFLQKIHRSTAISMLLPPDADMGLEIHLGSLSL